jgi:hypothetical protein
MKHIPIIRVGLLIIVGALFASVISFYIGTAQQLADMSGEHLSTEPRDLLNHFTANFLFAGATPGIMFWCGVLLCALGIVRNFMAGSTKKGVR